MISNGQAVKNLLKSSEQKQKKIQSNNQLIYVCSQCQNSIYNIFKQAQIRIENLQSSLQKDFFPLKEYTKSQASNHIYIHIQSKSRFYLSYGYQFCQETWNIFKSQTQKKEKDMMDRSLQIYYQLLKELLEQFKKDQKDQTFIKLVQSSEKVFDQLQDAYRCRITSTIQRIQRPTDAFKFVEDKQSQNQKITYNRLYKMFIQQQYQKKNLVLDKRPSQDNKFKTNNDQFANKQQISSNKNIKLKEQLKKIGEKVNNRRKFRTNQSQTSIPSQMQKNETKNNEKENTKEKEIKEQVPKSQEQNLIIQMD